MNHQGIISFLSTKKGLTSKHHKCCIWCSDSYISIKIISCSWASRFQKNKEKSHMNSPSNMQNFPQPNPITSLHYRKEKVLKPLLYCISLLKILTFLCTQYIYIAHSNYTSYLEPKRPLFWGKDLVLEGSNTKMEDKQVPGICIYIYMYINIYI